MKTQLSILFLFCACILPTAAEPIHIDSRRELFVERHIIGELKDTTLKLHSPQLMLPISPPRPHGHYATVLRAKDKFQFYYRGDTKKDNHWKKGWEQYHDGEVTLYAESKDGIHWEEPRLGIYEDHPTFPKGNVVLMNEFLTNHNFTPFIDTKPGVPAEEKYKALGGLAYQKHKEHLEVRVELQGADGKALPGFSLDDCDPIWGDHIARTVTRNKGSDLGALAGKPVKLRFVMNDADLFAIKFNQNPNPKKPNSPGK